VETASRLTRMPLSSSAFSEVYELAGLQRIEFLGSEARVDAAESGTQSFSDDVEVL
jgi:hypothetical protein